MSEDVLCWNRKPSGTFDREAIWIKSRRASNVSTGQGHWILLYDNQLRVEGNLTAHDIAWTQILDLVADDKIYLAKCSTAKPNDLHPRIGYIYCYTESSSDENAVRQAAEEIRRATNYGLDMAYKLIEKREIGWGSPQDFELYRHTVNNEFLKFVCRWSPTPKKFESQLWNVTPSRVLDTEFILIKSRKFFSMEGKKLENKLLQEGGFFILHFHRNEHDKAWSNILNLIREGVIVQAQCSTAKRHLSEQGVPYIHCYTEDYNDEEYIQEVAEQIRRATYYRPDIPYMLVTKRKLGMGLPQDFVLYKQTISKEFFTLKVDWIPVP